MFALPKWVQKGKCASIHGTKTTKAVLKALTEKGILSAFSSAIKKTSNYASALMPSQVDEHTTE